MQTIVPIVEGDGEVVALPLLLRRLGVWLSPGIAVHVQRPFRVHRDQFLRRQNVFERHLQSAARVCGDQGWILILLDADDDCPKNLSADILARAGQLIPHRRISVVLANREYEAWFIAAADSLNGRHRLKLGSEKLPAAESVRGAKEWLSWG